MSGFYILFDAGTLEGVDGLLVRKENHSIPNGAPALDGELSRSREPYDITGKKWLNGALVDMSEAEQAVYEAHLDALADAEAAARRDALPTVFESGIAVLDADGHHVELIPTGDSLPVLGVQISNSPLEKEQREAMKAARKAAHDALVAQAKASKLSDKQKIALLMQAVFGVVE